MAYFASLPFDALFLEACQPYYRYQVPQQERKARRCTPAPSAPAAPRFNASETAEAYKLYFSLPGLERKDISISMNDGVLSLEASRPADLALDQFRVIPAKLRRTWKVPELVDASSIRAKLANGELVITLPKTVKAEPRQVLISGDDDVPAAAPSAPAALEAAPVEPPAHAPKAEQAASAEGQANDNEPAGASEPVIAEAACADGQAMDAVKPVKDDDWVTLATATPVDAHGAGAAESSPAKGDHEATTAKSEEDGSVEDLSDEEREAERAARRPRALAPDAGPVLMDADEATVVAA